MVIFICILISLIIISINYMEEQKEYLDIMDALNVLMIGLLHIAGVINIKYVKNAIKK